MQSDGGNEFPSRGRAETAVLTIDREFENRILMQAWSAARQGDGRAVLVLGEVGIGKSTLATAFLNQVPSSDSRILAMRCFEQERSLPYSVWRGLIEMHPDLREAFPEPLGEHLPRANNAADLARRTALELRSISRGTPLLLAIDDVHLADEPSLGVLRALGQRLSGSNILLVLGCQTPLHPDSDISAFVQVLLRESPVQTVELHPLDDTRMAAVVEQRFPWLDSNAATSLVRELTRLSGGNALYTAELLSTLETRLTPDSSEPEVALSQIPLTLRQIVTHRISSLPQSTQETLKLAAIIGETWDPDLLGAVSGLPMHQLVSDVEQALAAEILVEDLRGKLRFRHGAVHQTLRDGQSQLRQRALHIRILEAQRQRGASNAEIALRAELAGDLATACEALEIAADEAAALFALPEAARLYERSVTLAVATNRAAEDQDRLRLALADAMLRQNPERAAREINRVVARSLARDDQLTLARARQRQATLTYEAGRRSEAIQLLDIAIPQLEQANDQETLAEALTCYVLCALLQSDFPLVETTAQKLLNLSNILGEPACRAVALWASAIATVARGEPADAPNLAREAVSILSEVGRLDTATGFATVAFMRVDLLANLHQPAMVDDLIARGEQLDLDGDRLLGAEPGQCTIEFSYWRYLRGDWERARTDLPDPELFREQPNPQVLREIVHMIAAEFAIAEGRNTAAEDLLHYIAPQPTAPSPDTSYQQWLFAVERLVALRIADHDLDGARLWLEAFDSTLEQNPHVPGELLFDLARARYQLASGEANEAEQTLVAATARAERTHNMLALVQAQRLLAEAHLALSQVEQALQAARRAEQEAANCALVYERACATVLIAEVLIRAGDRSGEALELLEGARVTLTTLGATGPLARVDQLMRQPMKTSSGEHLTRRELDVLRLVVAGNTDAEIGNKLYISPRTVGTHISNMLGKTGASNRVELATWAMSRRLVER